MNEMHNNYQHISFTGKWDITPEISYLLGECAGIIKAISKTPIFPGHRQKLLHVSLIKGAQATTAIEGNTLSIEDIENIQQGGNVPPSKDYQKQEVINIINAFNVLLSDIIDKDNIEYITPKLLSRFHYLIGKDIGIAFDAAPGQLRKRNVIVGNYRPPSFGDVENHIIKLCDWLKREFSFSGSQSMDTAIIEAVVAHIYIAWIHPFSDGNGRTARLVEFFVLMRAGVPDFASHILSNHYNKTRTMYYRQIENATKNNDLTDFLKYAIEGLRDGLNEVVEHVQESQLLISWKAHIFNVFDILKGEKKALNAPEKRRREFILQLPMEQWINNEKDLHIKYELFHLYKDKTGKTLSRDLKELFKLELLFHDPEKGYCPNAGILQRLMARRRK